MKNKTKKQLESELQNTHDRVEELRDSESELKQTIKTLKANEARYRSLIEHSNDAIYLLYDRKFEFINKKFQQMFGYSLDEVNVPNFDFIQLVAPKSRALIEDRLQKAAQGEELTSKYEFTALTKSGEELEVETSISYIDYKEGVASQGVIRDITERKKTEQARRELEERYKQLFDNINSAVAVYQAADEGKDFIFKDFNKAGERIEQIKKTEVLGKSVLEVFPNIKKFGLFEVFQRVWKSGNPEHYPVSFYQDDRISGWRDNYVCKLPTGEVVSAYEDVTEQKKAEEELQESNETLQSLFKAAPIGIGMVSHRVLENVNETLCEMIGYTAEELIGKSARILYPTDRDYEFVGKKKYAQIEKYGTGTVETRFQRKNGEVIDVLLSSSPVNPEDPKQQVTFTVLDITKQKRAEQELEESEEKYRGLFSSLRDAILVADTDRKIIDCNPAFTELFGYELEEIKGKETEYVYHDPQQFQEMGELIQQKMGEPDFFYTIDYEKKSGDVFPGETKVFYLKNDQGEITGFIGLIRDITERMQAERQLRESEEKYRGLFNSALAGITVHDSEGQIIAANKKAEEVFGISEQELMKKDVDFWTHSLFKPNGEPMEIEDFPISLVTKSKVPREGKTIGLSMAKDKDIRWFLHSARPIFNPDGNLDKIVTSFVEITEQKKAESQIQKNLKEKNVMLKEIHHRVKNNMQIISSLINLQSQNIKDQEALESFRICRERIKAMALIHESLYESQNLAEVDFSGYVKKMTTHLFAAHSELSERINFTVNIDPLFLDVNRAIPAGLIINELVSNAFKHGFPGGKSGSVSVKLKIEDSGSYSLMVSDTGMGFPESYDWKNPTTLGMQLVSDLVKQLNGTMNIIRQKGTKVRIKF
ncbi:MAG: PAS domain S-box protein [Candidatus Aminicenantes bacterium]|nr:PAS domain S-box protein [Candidatus Aminicenantes bacterium]